MSVARLPALSLRENLVLGASSCFVVGSFFWVPILFFREFRKAGPSPATYCNTVRYKAGESGHHVIGKES